MSVLLLITTQEIKDLTPLSDNTDDKKLRNHIQSAQDLYIKPAISETCYDALLDSVENDDPTALETTLLDGDNRSFAGLKIALAYWVAWLAYPDIWISQGNTGVTKKTSEKYEAVEAEDFHFKRQEIENVASSYTNYLISYIKKHTDDYTCYSCEGITTLIDDTNATGVATDYDKVTSISEAQEVLNRDNG